MSKTTPTPPEPDPAALADDAGAERVPPGVLPDAAHTPFFPVPIPAPAQDQTAPAEPDTPA